LENRKNERWANIRFVEGRQTSAREPNKNKYENSCQRKSDTCKQNFGGDIASDYAKKSISYFDTGKGAAPQKTA
jgi:hypothetical protein